MQLPSVQDLTALIVAIVGAIGTVGALVASVSAKLSASTHDIKLKKLEDDASTIGQLATAFAQKTTEQQDEIKTVAQVVTNLSPPAKNY